MKYRQTTALHKILAMDKRLKIIQGGSSAGKTIAILLILIDRAQTRTNHVISIVSETIPHLKRGAIRDFLNIMEAQGYYKEANWNRTDFIYTFETGSKIEFFSADSPDKVRGPRRDDLFMNEANNMSLDTYTQLAIRTNGDIFIDFNPVAQFWVHDEIIPKLEHDFIVLTYKDNEGLPASIVAEIESRKDNKYFWTVFGLGQLGEIQGKIYNGWILDLADIPHEARLERFAVDFGYSNDPTAIVAIYYYNGGYIVDELAFQKEMSNKQIADVILNQRKAVTVADSAEPKSIDDIRTYGVTIIPADKGKDSVNHGIQVVQDQQISVTKRSLNVIKEYRNYLWETDKDGRILPKPEHTWSHSMDAIRYGLTSLVPMIKRKEFIATMPRYDAKPKANPAR